MVLFTNVPGLLLNHSLYRKPPLTPQSDSGAVLDTPMESGTASGPSADPASSTCPVSQPDQGLRRLPGAPHPRWKGKRLCFGGAVARASPVPKDPSASSSPLRRLCFQPVPPRVRAALPHTRLTSG